MSRAPDALSTRRPVPGTVAVVAPHGDDGRPLRKTPHCASSPAGLVPAGAARAVEEDHRPIRPVERAGRREGQGR
ncbi:hypothetical protein ACFUIZ_17085 [Streptomyces cinereoruber]|uniref:hypothetical protein n=1 Tax=Streptomyces cinereoruber TaxID=67260 RepID=UPI003644D7FC